MIGDLGEDPWTFSAWGVVVLVGAELESGVERRGKTRTFPRMENGEKDGFDVHFWINGMRGRLFARLGCPCAPERGGGCVEGRKTEEED